MDERSRSRHVVALLLGGLSLGIVRPAFADEVDPAPGTRVRVTTARKRIVGRVLAFEKDVLLLEREGVREPLNIPRPDVLALEVSSGCGSRGRTAKIGALVGLGAAVALGVLAGEDCPPPPNPNPFDFDLCFDHAATGILSGILTVPLGALAGYAVGHGERWRPVTTPHVSLGVGPSRRGGASVRLAIAFR
jgi:hypothetical protein